ncbi:MAG: hypothetical protein OXR84_11305 [Magnetovibrio sp.]|nr:hypothetical protein [Magnetovibrio sp.]
MARKPNYRFDRLERERKKAAKKAAKLQAKREAREATDQPSDAPDADDLSAPDDDLQS